MNDQDQQNLWVIRTDFTDSEKWTAIRDLIAAPQPDGFGMEFYAYVEYKDEPQYSGMNVHKLVQSLPADYPGFVCFVVDATTINDDEHPILVVDFSPESIDLEDNQPTPKQISLSDIKTIRAVPATIQCIENNLSISNMDFEDFADSVDPDGVFRGFPE